ncbi:uncharacterized protein LOC127716136 [Mytilus californianus]|uniref:uncharacterized protein LOC127716136 n=1 Tax=Mytilus californianus TaxID=6549 RepID=UPI00224742A7|nr:uncharacterized protein LOC127716136 [Mytilus californianus]
MEVHSAVDQDKTCVEELFESNPYDPKLNQRLCPPYVTDIFHSDKIELIWDSLRPLTDEEAFQVSYRDSNGKWKTVDKTTNKTIMTIRGLKAETSYFFRVRLINDTTGEEGQYSMQSDAILTGKSSALEIKKKSSLLKNSTPPVYQLPIKEDTTARNPSAKTRKFVLGDSQHLPVAEEKTIMIVGATGSGKSTLINAMANYVFGVTWEDCFRFSLVDLEPSEAKRQVDQSHSQTEWVTCYTIYNSSCSRIDYTINLIDTPGFGDTRGLEQDSVIVDQIRELFSLKSCKGVVTLDAVCFLVKAPDSRMTITQRYIFDSILALFGNDIKENICTLITFADGQRPPVIDAIQSIEGVPLPYEHFFTFNNSALFAENEGTTKGSLSPMFWDMGIKSCKTFFDHVTTLNTKSLTLTAEVLNSRHTLQNKIYNLQQEVDEGMSKINTLEEEIEIFTKYKDAIKDNADFEYQVEELQQVKENLEGTGKYTTTCLVCNFTCHKFCKISDDRNKADCIAMKDGKCTQCPDSCAWNHHHNTPYIFKTITVRKRKRYAEKLKKYQEANQQRLSQEQVIANMKQDVETLDYKIQVLVVAISQLNNRLKKIALRSDPKSTVEYIELMIESEKRENRKGFKSRIDALERCKERAKYGIKVEIFQDRLRKSTTFLSTEQIDDAASENNSFWMVLKKFEGK